MSAHARAVAWGSGIRLRDEVRRAAHALKGSASNFVDDGPTATAFELETMGRNGQLDGTPAVLDRLEQEIVALKSACRTFNQRGRAVTGVGATRSVIACRPLSTTHAEAAINGPTLCGYLREVPALAGMYVILLTSHASKQDVIAGLESGADDYITKPFDWGELRARVRIGSRIPEKT